MAPIKDPPPPIATPEAKLLGDIERNTRDTADAIGTVVAQPTPAVPPQTIVTPAGSIVAVPTSTEEEDRNTAGQRAVNLMWESTQRLIALGVIMTSILVAGYLAIAGSADSQMAAMVFLFGVANLVAGFYFGRTNHQRIGGVQQGR